MSRAALDRLHREVGDLLDTHDRGLSFEELARYRGRFPDFCRDILHLQLTRQQLDAAPVIENHRQVLIQGGQALGKDTLECAWALYEVYAWGSLALLSGTSDRQVREVLMRREIGRLWRLSGGKLPGERYEMAIRIPGREEGGLLSYTAIDPEKWVGHHSPRVFIGLTEGQGISAEIFEAAQRCNPTHIVVSCNPTTPTCAAYKLSRSPAWKTLKWSCLDHSNVTSGKELIRGAVTREWVDAMRDEHGEGSRFWTYAVLGEWPTSAPDGFVDEEEIDAGVSRWERRSLEHEAAGQTVFLVADIARFGSDRTMVGTFHGPILRGFESWQGEDLMETATRIRMRALGIAESTVPPWLGTVTVRLVVDEIGVGGGVVDRIREINRASENPVVVHAFNGAHAAMDPNRYAQVRSEAHWLVREALQRGTIAIPPDDELREELLSVTWDTNARGQIQIESKDTIRPRLGRSPDKLDCLTMGVWMREYRRRNRVVVESLSFY